MAHSREELLNLREEEMNREKEEEMIIKSIDAIQNDANLQEFMCKFVQPSDSKLSRLSNKNISDLEKDTKVFIEYDPCEEDVFSSKRKTLVAFVRAHPWIKINNNKPVDSLRNWLIYYSKAAKLESRELLVIHRDGSVTKIIHD